MGSWYVDPTAIHITILQVPQARYGCAAAALKGRMDGWIGRNAMVRNPNLQTCRSLMALNCMWSIFDMNFKIPKESVCILKEIVQIIHRELSDDQMTSMWLGPSEWLKFPISYLFFRGNLWAFWSDFIWMRMRRSEGGVNVFCWKIIQVKSMDGKPKFAS